MEQANGNNLLIGRGRWYIDRFDVNGNLTGYRFIGEANKADLTPTPTIKERYSTTKASNPKIASVITQQKHTLSIELMEFVRQNVALAILGTDTVMTQAMTTVTNETIAGGAGQAPVAQGMTYLTSKTNISAVTLVAVASDGTTTTPLVAGTDYQIEDATIGAITLLSSLAAAGATIKATTYTAGVVAGAKVTGGTAGLIGARLLFIADPTSGPKMNAVFWKVQITPAAAIGFLSDDFASMTLDCEVLQDTIHTDLYEITYPVSS